jgi:hypothetical protein
MLTLTEQRDRAAAVERIIAYMRRNHLAPGALLQVGGGDPDYRRFEAVWALIARAGLTYADLEASPEFMSFAVSTSCKSKEAVAAGDDLSSLWS